MSRRSSSLRTINWRIICRVFYFIFKQNEPYTNCSILFEFYSICLKLIFSKMIISLLNGFTRHNSSINYKNIFCGQNVRNLHFHFNISIINELCNSFWKPKFVPFIFETRIYFQSASRPWCWPRRSSSISLPSWPAGARSAEALFRASQPNSECPPSAMLRRYLKISLARELEENYPMKSTDLVKFLETWLEHLS